MEFIDVLCINCENMISLDKISLHSSVCMAPTNYILKLSSLDPIKIINFRLDKLKCAMEAILHEEIKVLTTDEKMILVYLSRKSAEALGIKDSTCENAETCMQITKEISEYPADFISPCVSLYLERVKVIASQKAEVLLEEVKIKESSMNITSLIESRTSQLDRLKKQIEKFKQATGDPGIKSDYLEVNSVVDDIFPKSSIGSSLVSPKDEKAQMDIDELDNMFHDHEVQTSQKSNEDLQRYFYSKCLVIKLGFASRDPAQFIQIPDLYRKVKESAIPVDMWEEFIREQFRKPELWIKSKK